ncbi:MAG: phosphoenolpyruvate--protein phosphotransferase [Planctomycetes bacterium]|nr:phosphoenolpyruvate--protein phosphotransferase [Planctomycetota bacterium]
MPVFKGESVASGIALGPVYLQGFAEEDSYPRRIAADQVENELNGLRQALDRSRDQIQALKSKHGDTLKKKELRIFDVHIEYLQDPMFIDEIEKLVMNERYSVRAAIRKIVDDYDRIFQLVEDDYLRQRAGDFRDVATRVLRNLASPNGTGGETAQPADHYILAARKLTVNDLFKLDHDHVGGIVAEEGGISSHAGILARSMGIPTITGIRDLVGKVQNRDFVIIDAGTGEFHVDPDERLRAEYERAASKVRSTSSTKAVKNRPHATRDGAAIRIYASCGSTSEVELAELYGMDGIGLYRTELMFLVDSRLPSEDMLTHHYAEVAKRQGKDRPVAFRLLDVGGEAGLGNIPGEAERNPALGLRGIRSLLFDGKILRLQVRAILRASANSPGAAILVPFVTGISELQRVKAAVVEERLELRKQKIACAETIRIAPIIEVPAAAFMLHAFLNESSYVVVAVDDMQALLLASDRDNPRVRDYYATQHPAFFELIARMAREAKEHKKEIVLFGEAAADLSRLPFYLGVGIRAFSIAPVNADRLLDMCGKYTIDECRKIANRILEAPRSLDVQRLLLRYSRQ